jgi:hypothetical protein
MATLAIAAIAVLAAAAAGYLISLRVRPWWKCRACGGSGKTRSRVRPGATGTCRKCLGGRVPRLGIRVLNPDRARQMRPVKGVHKKADKRTS